MKALKIIILLCVIVIGGGIAAIAVGKQSAQDKIDTSTEEFIERAQNFQNFTQKLLNSSKFVYEKYKQAPETAPEHEFWMQYKPYLTSELLPEALRWPQEAFEVNPLNKQDPASATKMLIDVLAQQGIEASEWRIVSPHGLKIATVAKAEDQTFKLMDPAHGVVAMFQNQILIGPYAARSLIADGTDYRNIFTKLRSDGDLSFYEDFAHVMMAPPGMPLYVSVAAPVFEEPLVLGELDGDSNDVIDAAIELDLTPYTDYIGQKHGEFIRRSIYFTEAARITMTVTESLKLEGLDVNIKPSIEGNNLIFEVPDEQALIFEDGKSNLTSSHAQSYIPVDQIIIEPL